MSENVKIRKEQSVVVFRRGEKMCPFNSFPIAAFLIITVTALAIRNKSNK